MVKNEDILSILTENSKFFDFDENLFEVVHNRSSILRDIDIAFMNLQKDIKNKQHLISLVNNIRTWTNIKNVRVKILKNSWDTYVVPIYNSESLSKEIKLQLERRKTAPYSLASKTVSESEKYIKGMYIYIGQNMFEQFHYRELTAILLHEIGHTFAHTATFPTVLERILKPLSQTTTVGVSLTPLITSPVGIAILLASITMTRTISFLEHKGEYNADAFAAKYGYGKEMVTVLDKFRTMTYVQKKKNFLMSMVEYIRNFLFPSTHPSDKKRICKLVQTMKTDYIKHYPKIDSDLNTIMSDIKC